MNNDKLRSFLEGLYYVYQRRELINPDPLYFLYSYENVRDREIVGLIASSLAYGRVSQIMKSVEKVLARLTEGPHEFLINAKNFEIVPENFKHRFTTANDINNLLANISSIVREYDSLENFLGECLKDSHGDLLSGLDTFSDTLSRNKEPGAFSLVTAPRDKSAWLVRCDDVDQGGWKILRPSDLIVPTDTHMHNIARKLGFTKRKQADLKTALEITENFQKICQEDPAKYDFVLTRFGIRAGLNVNELEELIS